jgi:MraZ protein
VASRFVGRYEHSLDGKGRVILPARFRANFDTLAFVSKHEEGCLAIWTPEAFDLKAEEMALRLNGTPEERQVARAWSSGSSEVEMDRTGRVAIPLYLRQFARLEEGQTVLVHGAITHVELWDPAVWEIQGAPGDASLVGPAVSALPAPTPTPTPAATPGPTPGPEQGE